MLPRNIGRFAMKAVGAVLVLVLALPGICSAQMPTTRASQLLARAGWNLHATRFMYAPAFEVAAMPRARRYVLTVQAKTGPIQRQARSDTPRIDLGGIWAELPSARGYRAWIEALDDQGRLVGRTDAFEFHKVAPFEGPYRQSRRTYSESGKACAEYVLRTLEPWERIEPGAVPAIEFPALFYSAYIRILTTYAALEPAGEKSQRALRIARKLGVQTIRTRTPSDWVYGNMPLSHKPGQYLQVSRTAMAGLAYLDLHAATGDREFLDAALRIAQTLKNTQLPDGRWNFRVEPKTGKLAEDYTSDQAEAIWFLDALAREYGRKELAPVIERAVNWMLENPVKSNHWQQQWDDVALQPPCRNLEFYDTAFFAMYLLRHATPRNEYRQTAEKLFRYVEDQFVLWENSYNPQFIAPGVQEQYLCYITIDWHAAHFIRLCMAMHEATGEEIYLQKARAMADTLTVIQHPDGYFPTWMRQTPAKNGEDLGKIDYSGLWPNCMSYTAEMLIKLDRYLSLRKARAFAKPWNINLPRPTMRVAWQHLRELQIPGAALDQRFDLRGAMYYVRPTGDDSADGSQEHPWNTLEFAARQLKPGATVYLMAGTYHGPIEIRTKATAQSPLAIRALPGQDVLITYSDAFIEAQKARIASAATEGAVGADGKSLHYPSLITITGTFIEISGLHLIGARERLPMNLYSENGISLAAGGGEGCRVLYNEIENTGHCGVKEMGHGGKNFLIEGNYIHDIGHTAHDHAIYLPADDVIVRRNILINSAGWGVHAYSAPRRLELSRNIIGGSAEDAVILAGSDCIVANNVFYKDNKGGVFFFRRDCRNNKVINNIIVDPTPFRFDSAGSAAPGDQPRDNTIDYNCIFGAQRTGAIPSAAGAHNIQADPTFVDAANFDFRLQPGSRCIGAGDPKSLRIRLADASDMGL